MALQLGQETPRLGPGWAVPWFQTSKPCMGSCCFLFKPYPKGSCGSLSFGATLISARKLVDSCTGKWLHKSFLLLPVLFCHLLFFFGWGAEGPCGSFKRKRLAQMLEAAWLDVFSIRSRGPDCEMISQSSRSDSFDAFFSMGARIVHQGYVYTYIHTYIYIYVYTPSTN